MQTSTTKSSPMPVSRPTTTAISYPWLMLISRSVLFLLFQVLIALILAATGMTSAWDESARWWTFMAFLANFVSTICSCAYSMRRGRAILKSSGFHAGHGKPISSGSLLQALLRCLSLRHRWSHSRSQSSAML